MKVTASLLLLLSLVASSCGTKDSTPASAINPADTNSINENLNVKNDITLTSERAVEVNDDFSNIRDVRENLNTFKIVANFERPTDRKLSLKCSKVIGSRNDISVATIDEGTTSQNLEVSLNDNELKVDVNCQVISESKEYSSATFSLQRSYVISKTTPINSLNILKIDNHYTMDRLIILIDGVLITNGQDLNLTVKDFYSNNGSIKTFDTKDNHENKIGKSGGAVSIKVDNSYGSLDAYVYGQNGGEQTIVPEKKIFPGLIEDPSRDAIASVYEVNCLDSNGGRPPCSKNVIVRGKNADAGQNGIKGDDAYPGNPGGDSGTIQYVTKNSTSDFKIRFLTEAGMGGKAGKPGEGSQGSKGGKGVPGRPAGADGVKGATGALAKDGEDGKIQISCWENLSNSARNCSSKEK